MNYGIFLQGKKVKVFENRLLTKISGAKKGEVSCKFIVTR
jgi:hypothetical protein